MAAIVTFNLKNKVMKRGIIILIVIFFAGWQTYSQCDPRLSIKPPEDPNHFVKSFEAFMPNENDTVLKYTLLLHEGIDYQIEIYEAPEYLGKATYSLYEGNKVIILKGKEEAGWRKVRRFDGKTGWVPSQTVERCI